MDALLWITVLSCVSWLYLALGHAWFWRTDVTLPGRPDDGPVDAPLPPVTVVVPARDESGVLPLSLPSLLAQAYPGPARVVLVDDDSSDGTGDVARALAADPSARLPLTVTTPGPPPPGWTGKLWAVRHGVSLAPDDDVYVLFTDADIAHAPDSLARLVRAAEDDDLDLVSVMARLRTETAWERLVVPAFVYFFAKLFPFRRVNRDGSRTAAAAGGCVLVRRAALARAGGIEAVRDAVIDDVALGTAVKRAGGRIRLVLSDSTREAAHVDSVRPYPRLADLWRMVSRSAFAQLRHSWALLAGTVAGLVVVYVAPPLAVLAGAAAADVPVFGAGVLAWGLMTATYVPMCRAYDLPAAWALTLPAAAVLYLGMTVDSAVRHARGRGAAWKGRTYPAPAARD